MIQQSRQVPHGRSGAPAPVPVRAVEIRRGVVALVSLSDEHRRNPAARLAGLFYALRGDTGGVPLETLVSLVDSRIGAFVWMIANQPQLIPSVEATAALEAAVYEAIATEPLVKVDGHHRFDPTLFLRRVERSLSRHSRLTAFASKARSRH